jgi:hypothetical protein
VSNRNLFRVLITPILAFATAFGEGQPPQHLAPDNGGWIVSSESISKEIGTDISVLCEPSFESPWAIGMRADGELTEIKVIFRRINIQNSGGATRPDLSFKDISASLDEETAAIVRQAWIRVLRETRYPLPTENAPGLDGEVYHFGCGEMMSGQIWSPEEKTLPGRLVSLTTDLRNYVTGYEWMRPVRAHRLRSEAKALYEDANKWPGRIVRQRDDSCQTLFTYWGDSRLASFSKDGRLILTSADKNGVVWNAQTGERIAKCARHNDDVNGGSFSPDGKLVVTTCTGGNIIVCDAKTGRRICSLGSEKETAATGVFTPDSKSILTAQDHAVKVWNARTGQLLNTFSMSSEFAYDISLSADGARLAVAGDKGSVRLIDTATGKILTDFLTARKLENRVYLSPAADRFLTIGDYKQVQLWDMTGKELKRVSPKGHIILAAKFVGSTVRVASATEDAVVHIWELDGEKKLADLEGHIATPYTAAFSPDGNTLVTCGNDQTAKVWCLPPAEKN